MVDRMKRKEALEKFQAEHQKEREEIRQNFWNGLQEHTDELMEQIYAAFEKIGRQAREKEKDDLVHFQFSLMRCDLIKGRANIRLDGMGMEWFVDENTLMTEFDLTFLFRQLFDWKEKLLLAMRPYMGKVNKYDIENMVQDEAMVCNQLITHLLRFAFRNIETYNAFLEIPKLPFWEIRWGEYKDYSEIVLQVNREAASLESWKKKLEDCREEPESLVASYWYQGSLTAGDCRKKHMYFAAFEECLLSDIDFRQADLTGARFLRCRIADCDFTKAVLDQTLFEDCRFENCRFAGASMKQAVFSGGFEPELFDEKQMEELLVEEKGEAQEGAQKEGQKMTKEALCTKADNGTADERKDTRPEHGKRYFFWDQDNTLGDAIALRDFDINGKRHIFTREDAERMNDVTSLYLDERSGECAPDFIKSPVYMVSEMAKGVVDMYEDDLIFKKIVLIHKEEERQLSYYHLLLKEIGALDEETEYYPNGMVKRMVLSREKIGDHKVFLLGDSKIRLPVVSLEVAESLLRRNAAGIIFQEIEVK